MANASPWWANAVLTAGLALVAAAVAISFDRRKTVNQELIRKRIAVYDEMAPKLNDILCFFRCIGAFKSLPPPAIIAHKRELDRLIHIYQTIFDPRLRQRYDAYIRLCFAETKGGTSQPAPIRANFRLVKAEWGDEWQEGWGKMLVPGENNNAEVAKAYEALMRQFGVELSGGGRGSFLPRPRWLSRKDPD